MARAKRVRWECPNGLHPAVLGSTRPRANATVRFCLPCSEKAGVLVERVAPALERKRAAKTAVRQSKAERQREREREARENALKVPVIDRDGNEFVLDAGELLREAWEAPTLREARRGHYGGQYGRHALPQLVIRRGKGRTPVRERPLPEGCLPVRQRDTMSGHADRSAGRIVLTVAPGLGHEWLRAVIVHEAAHVVTPGVHGPQWRSAYLRAMRELYPDVREWPLLQSQAAWRLDEQIATAVLNARAS